MCRVCSLSLRRKASGLRKSVRKSWKRQSNVRHGKSSCICLDMNDRWRQLHCCREKPGNSKVGELLDRQPFVQSAFNLERLLGYLVAILNGTAANYCNLCQAVSDDFKHQFYKSCAVCLLVGSAESIVVLFLT